MAFTPDESADEVEQVAQTEKKMSTDDRLDAIDAKLDALMSKSRPTDEDDKSPAGPQKPDLSAKYEKLLSSKG